MIYDYLVMYEQLFAKTGLSLERVRTLCEIAEAGGVSKAARGNPVRQSQYSRQLKELEEHFGVELFRRKGKTLAITAAGERLRVVCRQFLECLARLTDDFAAVAPVLAIGAGEAILDWVLMPQLADVRRSFPGAHIELTSLRSAAINGQLLDGEIDFGIVRQDACSAELKVEAVGVMDYSLFVPRRLARQLGSRSASTLLKELPLATLQGEGQFRSLLLEGAAAQGIRLKIELACSTFLLATQAVRQGTVAGILPSLAEVELPPREYARIEVPFLRRLRRAFVLGYNPRVLATRPAVAAGVRGLAHLLRATMKHAADKNQRQPDQPQ
jgi:DNA-binding transcriptional LysR family regulator